MITFKVLGPLSVERAGKAVDVSAMMLQRMLALLLCADGPLPLDALAEAMWDGRPPRTARKTLQVYVHRLRRALGEADRLTHGSGGYSLEVKPGELDSQTFESLVQEAGRLKASGDLAGSLAAFDQALGLWRGEAYAQLFDLSQLDAERRRLNDLRLDAVEARAEIALAANRHDQLVGELTEVVAQHPFREGLRAQLMLALYRAGRRADALELFRATRELLAGELGVDPTAQLQRLHGLMLREDPSLDPPPAEPRPGKRFLPHDIPDFVGRQADLDWLDSSAQENSPVVLNAISGTAGVGKTALAVHWAHRVQAKFPDGQLFVNLRGYHDGPPLRPIEAATHLLRCLGVPSERLPTSLDAATAQYRSLLAAKRMLILLDNARTADQVRPLLPGEPGCKVVITSRDKLSGLIATEGARRMTVGLMAIDEAVELLSAIVGRDRVASQLGAATGLAEACGRLPLALRIAAAHLVDRPDRSIEEYLAELASSGPMEALRIDEDEHTAVAAVLHQSYRALPAPLQEAFRLLAMVQGPDFTADYLAALTGAERADAGAALDTLFSAHMIEHRGSGRYAFHDLIRDYARAILRDSGERLDAPRDRLFAFLNEAAEKANATISGANTGADAQSPEEAMRWLEAERGNLVATVAAASRDGLPSVACDIARSLWHSFHYSGHTSGWIATFEYALAAIGDTGDQASKFFLLNALGQGYSRAGQYENALRVHRDCLAGRVAAGDEVGAARSRCNLAITYERQGHYLEALAELEPALAVLHEHGERMIEAGTRATALVGVLNRLGRLEEARENLLLALETFEEIGTPFDRIRALCSLAETNRLLGRLDEALRNLEEAEALAERVRDRNSVALVTNRLADVLHDRADFAGAIDSRLRGLELFRHLGVRGGECEGLNGLGKSYLATGSLDRARQAFDEALVIADELGSAHQRGRALAGIGRIVRSREHLAEAMSILEQVAPLEAVELKNVLDDWS